MTDTVTEGCGWPAISEQIEADAVEAAAIACMVQEQIAEAIRAGGK